MAWKNLLPPDALAQRVGSIGPKYSGGMIQGLLRYAGFTLCK
jgi:hypothetical protein